MAIVLISPAPPFSACFHQFEGSFPTSSQVPAEAGAFTSEAWLQQGYGRRQPQHERFRALTTQGRTEARPRTAVSASGLCDTE